MFENFIEKLKLKHNTIDANVYIPSEIEVIEVKEEVDSNEK